VACAALVTAAPPAAALDGCLVLLCLAAPSWRAIPQCVPPITQLLRDLALGRVFPSCGMSGPGNSGSHQWAAAPTFCPPQYTRAIERESQTNYTCDFTGAVSVSVNGTHFSRTWWSMTGDTVWLRVFPRAATPAPSPNCRRPCALRRTPPPRAPCPGASWR
jgi:hypothetical protein